MNEGHAETRSPQTPLHAQRGYREHRTILAGALALALLAQPAVAIAQPDPVIHFLTSGGFEVGDPLDASGTTEADDLIWIRPDGRQAEVTCSRAVCELREWFGGAGEYRIGSRRSTSAPDGEIVTFTGDEFSVSGVLRPDSGWGSLRFFSAAPPGVTLVRSSRRDRLEDYMSSLSRSNFELQNGSQEPIAAETFEGQLACRVQFRRHELWYGEIASPFTPSCIVPRRHEPEGWIDLAPGAVMRCADARMPQWLDPRDGDVLRMLIAVGTPATTERVGFLQITRQMYARIDLRRRDYLPIIRRHPRPRH